VMPRIGNVFGAAGDTVSGASIDDRAGSARDVSGEAPWPAAGQPRPAIEVAPLSIPPLSMEPVVIAPIPTTGKQD